MSSSDGHFLLESMLQNVRLRNDLRLRQQHRHEEEEDEEEDEEQEAVDSEHLAHSIANQRDRANHMEEEDESDGEDCKAEDMSYESSSPAIEAMVPDGRWSEMEVPSNTSTPPAPPPASSKPKHFSSGSDSLNFDPGLSPINLVDELFVGDDWSQFLPEKKELVSVKSCPAVAEEKEEEEEEETLGPDTTDQSFHGIPEYEMKRSRSGSSCSSDHPQSLEVDESEQSPLEDLEGMKQEPSEMEEEREANTDDEEGEEEERSSMDHIPDPEADNNQSETLIETMEDTSHPEEEEEILSPVSPDAEVTPSLPPLDLSSIERSEMLDNSVYRNRANLNRKRGHRAPVQVPRNCREDREAENESDWMFRDSTEPRAAAEAAPTNNDDENGDEGDGRDVKCARLESSPVKGSPARSPISPAGRVQLFPGVDASTLQEKLKFPKKSGDACDAASSEKAGASDEDALSPSKTSPGGKTKLGKFPGFSKDIFKRVLPKKAAKTEGGCILLTKDEPKPGHSDAVLRRGGPVPEPASIFNSLLSFPA
ncbi:TB182 protein, partial [Polypterus senegalus]